MILPKYKISWDDITNIYNDLNIQRARFSMAQVAIPIHTRDKVTTEQLNSLVDSVEGMSTSSWIGQKAETGVIIPDKGDKIKTIEYNLIKDTLTTIGGICPHCNCQGYCPNYGDCDDCDDCDNCDNCSCNTSPCYGNNDPPPCNCNTAPCSCNTGGCYSYVPCSDKSPYFGRCSDSADSYSSGDECNPNY